MARMEFKRRLPGYIATGLVILTTSGWTFWGLGEMSYEGWGSPFPAPMRYLIPGAACLAFTLVALTWPLLGGWLLILISGAFTAWWWRLATSRGWLNLRWILSTWPLQMSSLAILPLSYYRPEGETAHLFSPYLHISDEGCYPQVEFVLRRFEIIRDIETAGPFEAVSIYT